ncbi:MAG: two-component system cell cycle sensor histidine kinase/response regulator CckA [Limisphaerales bacterium]|jgi:two-component system cell cycle sensor histidine kinase/response regulator CckA
MSSRSTGTAAATDSAPLFRPPGVPNPLPPASLVCQLQLEDTDVPTCSGNTVELFGVAEQDWNRQPLLELFDPAVQDHVGSLIRASNLQPAAAPSLLRTAGGVSAAIDLELKRLQSGSELVVRQTGGHQHSANQLALHTVAVELDSAGDPAGIVASVARLTGAECCLFGRVADNLQVRATACVIAGKPVDGFVYDMPGTPCEAAFDRHDGCAFPAHVQDIFPQAKQMVELGIQAYLGVSLLDAAGQRIGILAAMFKLPLAEIQSRLAAMRLFARKAEHTLESELQLADLAPFRTVFDQLSDGVLVVAAQTGLIADTNECLASMLGYHRRDLLNQPISSVDSTLASLDQLVDWTNARRKGAAALRDDLFCQRDGTLCPVETSSRSTEFNGQEYIIIGVRDAAQRRAVEGALRQSEQRFRALIENSSDVITILDPEGRIQYVSPTVKRILGHAPDDLVDGSILNHILPSDREQFTNELAEWIRKPGEIFAASFDWKDPDGGVRHIAARVSNQLVDPAVQAIVLNMRDVTQRVQSTSKARRQADLINRANDAICVWNTDGIVLSWNNGAASLYGIANSEVFGKSVAELSFVDPDVYAEAMETVQKQGNWTGEFSFIDRKGAEISVHSRWTLLRDDSGQPEDILAIDRNITAQKRVENQLLRHQRMEGIGTLASGIAHDLNNILMPILMMTTTMRREAVDEESAEALDMVIHSAKRGADIVRQVLTYVRGAEGSRMFLKPQTLIKEVLLLFKETFPKQLQLVQNIPEGEWLISGNMTELSQVLLNLAVNARDSMPDGGTLSVGMEEVSIDQDLAEMKGATRPGEYVVFRVRDTGGGIAPVALERIFDPFFTTKAQGAGTGLGLATVKGIVESHDGFLEVESTLGRGSTFSVYIPAVLESRTEIPSSDTEPPSEGRGQTVLIIDDEDNIRKTLRRMLERYGYNVILAQNGVEGISKFTAERKNIAAIITDIMMPELSGIDFVKVIRNMDANARIIVSSGKAMDEHIDDFEKLGVNEFLAKPYAAVDLLRRLEKLLRD